MEILDLLMWNGDAVQAAVRLRLGPTEAGRPGSFLQLLLLHGHFCNTTQLVARLQNITKVALVIRL